MSETIVSYAGYKATIELKEYAKPRNPRLQLWCEDGPLCTASINPDTKLEPGLIAIKDTDDNEGVLDALVAAGVVERTSETVRAGFYIVPVCKLLKTE